MLMTTGSVGVSLESLVFVQVPESLDPNAPPAQFVVSPVSFLFLLFFILYHSQSLEERTLKIKREFAVALKLHYQIFSKLVNML